MSKVKKFRKPNPHAVSNAVSVTVYDMSGAPIAQDVADEIVNSITAVAQREKYVVNYTRT